MVKEISISTDDVMLLTNGIVLKRYDKINDCYDFKIIADVGIIRYSNGIVRAYGDFHDMEGVNLNPHINSIPNPNNPFFNNIPILIVDKNVSKFDDGNAHISDGLDDTGKLEGSYVLSAETKSGYPYTCLYVDYDSFNEESYRKVKTNILYNSL